MWLCDCIIECHCYVVSMRAFLCVCMWRGGVRLFVCLYFCFLFACELLVCLFMFVFASLFVYSSVFMWMCVVVSLFPC